MSFLIRVLVLVVLWLLAWGELSVSFVLSGVAVATVMLLAFPPARGFDLRLRFSPVAAIRLVWYVARQLVLSNLLVAREIVSRRSRVRAGVLAYRVQSPSDEVLTLMANVTALTPGTMAVEVTREPPVLYVHFLLLRDVDAARRTLAQVEALVVATFGGPAQVMESPTADHEDWETS